MAIDEKMLKQHKLDFMLGHSVCPDDGVVKGAKPGVMEKYEVKGGDVKRSIKLIPNTKNEFGSFKVADGGSFDVQFLPWLTHSIIWMDMQGSPDFFFTAGINGCSVFVTGDPNSPRVYHAGIGATLDAGAYKLTDKTKNDPIEKKLVETAGKKDAPLFWRLMLDKQFPKATADKNFAEINKTHYVTDGTASPLDNGKSTKRAVAYEKLFVDKNKDALKVKMMTPWGCVFGMKSGGWKFYLQENVTIFYSDKEGKKPHAASVPIAVTQFYPKGQEKTNLVKTQNTFISNPFTKSDLVFEGWMPK